MIDEPYVFTDKQNIAYDLLCNDDYIYYLFDGPSRCGKTFDIIAYIVDYLEKYPGANALIGRYYLANAKKSVWKQTLIPYIKATMSKSLYKIVQSNQDFIVTFHNGSTIVLGGLEKGDQLDKVMGTEWAIIFINEVVEDPYDTYQAMKSRLQHKSYPLKFITDTNPKNPSHWVYKQFIKGINPETGEKVDLSTQCRLSWTMEDNVKNLSPRYFEIMKSMTGVRGKRLRDGIWCEVSEGTVYEFNRDVSLLPEPISPVPESEKWCGWDFGIAADTALIFFQVHYFHPTPENKLGLIISIFDEYRNNEKDYKYYADVVKAKGYQNLQHAGDPAGVARDAQLKSWFSLLKTEGIHLQKPSKRLSVADMIHNVNQYMPYIRINETQCPYMVEVFENWTYKKDKDGKTIDGSLPEHNDYSHLATAFYYAISNCFPIKRNREQIQIY
jgi:phage terminase large subunit